MVILQLFGLVVSLKLGICCVRNRAQQILRISDNRSEIMPFVNVRTVKGLLSPEKKEELQTRLTDLLVEIEGHGDPNFRPYVWVLVEELGAPEWTFGGYHFDPAKQNPNQ